MASFYGDDFKNGKFNNQNFWFTPHEAAFLLVPVCSLQVQARHIAAYKEKDFVSLCNSPLIMLQTLSVITLCRLVIDFILTAELGHVCVQCGKIQRPTIFPASSLDQGSQVGFWDMETW